MDVFLCSNNADNVTVDGAQREGTIQLHLPHGGEKGPRKSCNRCTDLMRREAAKLLGVRDVFPIVELDGKRMRRLDRAA